jgi:hypothetical protein
MATGRSNRSTIDADHYFRESWGILPRDSL